MELEKLMPLDVSLLNKDANSGHQRGGQGDSSSHPPPQNKASTSSWGRGSPALSLLLKHHHPSSPHKAPPPSTLPNAWQVTRSEGEQQEALQDLLAQGLDLRQCSDVTVDPSPFRVPEL
jgi:hypothetical protein